MNFEKFSDVCMMGNNPGEFAQDLCQMYRKRAMNISDPISSALSGTFIPSTQLKDSNILVERMDDDGSTRFIRLMRTSDIINSLRAQDTSEFYPQVVRCLSGYYPDSIPTDGTDVDACIPEVRELRDLFSDIASDIPDVLVEFDHGASSIYAGCWNDYISIRGKGDPSMFYGTSECMMFKYTLPLVPFGRLDDRLFLYPDSNHSGKYVVDRTIDPLSDAHYSDTWKDNIGVGDICATIGDITIYLKADPYGRLYAEGSNGAVMYFLSSPGPCCKVKFIHSSMQWEFRVYPWQKLPDGYTEYGLLANTDECCRLEIYNDDHSVGSYVYSNHFCNYVNNSDMITQTSDQIARLYTLSLIFGAIPGSSSANDFRRNLSNSISFTSSPDSLLLSYVNDFQNQLTEDDDQTTIITRAINYAFASNGDLGTIVEEATDSRFILASFLKQDANVGSMAPWLSLSNAGLHILSKSSNVVISNIGRIIELPFTVSEFSYAVLKKVVVGLYESFVDSYISPLVFKTNNIGKRFLKQSKYSFSLPVTNIGLGYVLGDNMDDHVLYQVSIPGGYVYMIKDASSGKIYFQIKPMLLSSDMRYGSANSFYPDDVNEFASQVQIALQNPFIDTAYMYDNATTPHIQAYTGNEAILLGQRAGMDLFVQSIGGLAHDASFFVDKGINMTNSQRESLSVIYSTLPSTFTARSMHKTSRPADIYPMTLLDDLFMVDDIIDNNHQSSKVVMTKDDNDTSIIHLSFPTSFNNLGYLSNHPAELIALTGIVCASLLNNDSTFVNQYQVNKIPEAMFALKTQNELNLGAYVWTASVLTVAIGALSIVGYFAARVAFQKSVLANASNIATAVRAGDYKTAQKSFDMLIMQTKFGGIFGVGSFSGSVGTASILDALLPSGDVDLMTLATKDDVRNIEDMVELISDKISH